jgi:hypothetical protein
MSVNTPVFKDDDTGAFGNDFITINLNNPLNYVVSKVEFIVNGGGCIPPKFYENPVFPLKINFTREETSKFLGVNVCRLRAYDENGLRKTCNNSLTFYAQNGVIVDVCR